MKIYKHENSEIFDAYARQMLKYASTRTDLLEGAVDLARGGAKAAPDAAGIVADLTKAQTAATDLATNIGDIRLAVEALESGRPVPSRYAGWDRKKFLDVLKAERAAARLAAAEADALIKSGKIAGKELADAQKALADITKAYDDAVDTTKRLDELAAGVARVEKGVGELAAGQTKITGHLGTMEGTLKAILDYLTKTSGKVPTENIIGSLDDAVEINGDAARLSALLKIAKEEGVEGTADMKILVDAMKTMQGQIDALVRVVDKSNPGSHGDIMKVMRESFQQLEEKTLLMARETLKAGGKGNVEKTLRRMFMEPIAVAAGASVIAMASFLVLLGLAGGGLWLYMRSDENYAAIAEKQVDDISAAIRDSISKVSPLAFRDLTDGEEQQANILDSLREADAAVLELKTTPDPKRVEEILAILDELYLDITEFTTNSAAIKADLASPAGFQEALDSLYHLKIVLGNFKELLDKANRDRDRNGAGETEGRGPGPAGRVSPGEGRSSGAPELLRDIYNAPNIDLSHLGRNDRSSTLYLIDKRISHPVYMAFIDPENIWGGAIQKTGNKKVDYLQSLKALAQNNLTSPGKVRRWMKGRMRRMGEKHGAGWRSAIRHYRQKGSGYLSKWKREIRKDETKSANLNLTSEFSINSHDIFMRKMADQFANSYYQDAVKGLGEQYAKSYYAGLKGMYEQNFGNNSEADYFKLYETHDETGAQLIGKAHPQSVAVADAMGKGGLVENLLEQQRRNIGVALSAPTGNFRARHAQVIQSLVKLANEADEAGLIDASDFIDKTIDNLVDY